MDYQTSCREFTFKYTIKTGKARTVISSKRCLAATPRKRSLEYWLIAWFSKIHIMTQLSCFVGSMVISFHLTALYSLSTATLTHWPIIIKDGKAKILLNSYHGTALFNVKWPDDMELVGKYGVKIFTHGKPINKERNLCQLMGSNSL